MTPALSPEQRAEVAAMIAAAIDALRRPIVEGGCYIVGDVGPRSKGAGLAASTLQDLSRSDVGSTDRRVGE